MASINSVYHICPQFEVIAHLEALLAYYIDNKDLGVEVIKNKWTTSVTLLEKLVYFHNRQTIYSFNVSTTHGKKEYFKTVISLAKIMWDQDTGFPQTRITPP